MKPEAKALSESEYSGDDEEKKMEKQDAIAEQIRARMPHLSRKKCAAMQRCWSGRRLANERRRKEMQELRRLRAEVEKRNQESVIGNKNKTHEGPEVVRKLEKAVPLCVEAKPESIFDGFF